MGLSAVSPTSVSFLPVLALYSRLYDLVSGFACVGDELRARPHVLQAFREDRRGLLRRRGHLGTPDDYFIVK